MSFGVIAEEGAVDVAVLGREEDVLASVASMRDVVRAVGDDDSGESGHEGNSRERKGGKSRNTIPVPVFTCPCIYLSLYLPVFTIFMSLYLLYLVTHLDLRSYSI